MRTVRIIATLLYYCSRIASFLYLFTAAYALVVLLFSFNTSASWVPVHVGENGSFQIFYPFTKTIFLLGDYNPWYITISILTIGFYGLFLWLLSDVFYAFKQTKLFTRKGFLQLSRFYIANLTVPVLLLLLLASFGRELNDIIRITFLHLVIG